MSTTHETSTPLDVQPPPIRVLAVAGSLRQRSYNRRLLEVAARHAPPGVDIEVFDGLGAVPLFNADLEGDDPPGVESLRRAVDDADVLLISTPEYSRGVPGVVKNMLDWLSRKDLGSLRGKPVGIVGATPGRWGTRLAQTQLAQMVANVGGHRLIGSDFYLAGAGEAFDDDRLDPSDVKRLRGYLEDLAQWGRLVIDRENDPTDE